jgi:hypothetical protein
MAAFTAIPGTGRHGGFFWLSPDACKCVIEMNTRQPFRRRIVPGTTREHANDHATALQHVRPAPVFAPAKDGPAPTQATLPDYGL